MTEHRSDRRVPFLDLRVSQRDLDDELDGAWRRITRSGSFIGGPEVEAFERAWAAACRTTDAIGVANGTDAIELALLGLGIGAGDEVVVPANTFVATAEAIVAAGARPVFADVDPHTLLLTPEALAASLTPTTAAVIVVHLFGQAADMPALGSTARRAGIAVVEDCAQAHGTRWNGRPVGSFGDAGCHSFYPGKNLGAFGDGGAVVTSDAGLADRVRRLSNHGRSSHSRFIHDVVGRNSRLDAIQAAVLLTKLRHLEHWNAERRLAHDHYASRLANVKGVQRVHQRPESLSSHHLEVVRVARRDAVLASLRTDGIEASVHYPVPCHLNPAYTSYRCSPAPVSERAADEILSLPMFPGITEAQVDEVCRALLDAAVDGGPS